MKLPRLDSPVTVAVLLGGALLYRYCTTPGHATPPGNDEDLQLHKVPYSLPSEFVQWSPVSWAGRCRSYPGAAGAGLTQLIYKGPPDWADQDR